MEGIGTRVVRGPDWKWAKQDGGEGRVGTLRSFESHEEVLVVWDNGTAANYRCSSHFDLRILDNSSAGIKHDDYTCDGCQVMPIYGIRWECAECPSISLCSMCYHGDKHSLRHTFNRLCTPTSRKVNVPVRRKGKKISSRGLYPGARVIRGTDWNWDEQDGGEGRKGKVIEVDTWNGTIPRSAVYVVWDNGSKNLYRVGFEGMVDVRVTSEAKGIMYYRDHLPVLGEDISVAPGFYEIGDHVCVDSSPEMLATLQHGHGGWAEGMRDVIGQVGVVSAVDEDGDVVVQYSNDVRWTFNPIALKKVEVHEENPNRSSVGSISLSGLLDTMVVGDVVRIANDEEYVKNHQKGHGEWTDSMAMTLGQVGRVTRILPSGDLLVEVCGGSWTYSPAVINRVDADGVPLTPGTSHHVSVMLRHVFESHQPTNPVEELVKAAAAGDVAAVEEVLSQELCMVDETYGGQSALHVACQNGHIDVVRLLITKGANLEEEDKDGDQAVHYASFGDEPEMIHLLAQYGVDLNARNRRQQTPLHVAVTKGHLTVIEVLLEHECHPSLQDSGGDTPLHDAITRKRDDLVHLLLEGGADITVTNSNGFNCLHHASLRGNLGAVRLIIQYLPTTMTVDTPKDDGFTALHLATLNNHIEVAKILLLHGAMCNAENHNKQTPLHLAVERQNTQIVRLLVEEGAIVNSVDRYGDTPLHGALRHHTMTQLKDFQESQQNVAKVFTSAQKKKSSSIAQFLSANGADLTLSNNSNQTPIDLCSDPSLIKLLERVNKEYLAQQQNGGSKLSVPGGPANITLCSVCSTMTREVLVLPCGHVSTCQACAVGLSKCTMCQGTIGESRKIEECVVCSEQQSSVLFQPCNHMVACESCSTVMKKCVVCRVPIETSIPLAVCCGGKPPRRRSSSKAGILGPAPSQSQEELSVLQQQLQEMKEKNTCPICMARSRNCIFLCGHGTCQPCADKITECPICRKQLKKKIIVYD